MRTFLTGIVLAVLVIGGGALAFSAFIVDQTHQALVLRFGNPARVIKEPGLYWRTPFAETVAPFDKRILDLETSEDNEIDKEIIVAGDKRLVVDTFARYRIVDPLKFYQAYRSEDIARKRLISILESTMRTVLGKAEYNEIVRDKREALMGEIKTLMNDEMRKSDTGVEVADVRIRHADLPKANTQAIFKRMRSEREREAAEYRAKGSEEAQRIRATADKEVTVLRANANRDSERIRGEGDEERNHIYAEVFSKDPDFFAFYRSMQAYEEALKGSHTRIVLSPTSEFFHYFNSPSGPGTPAPAKH